MIACIQTRHSATCDSGSGTQTATLATVNNNPGTFGSETSIPVVTVNAKGLITGISTASATAGAKFYSQSFTNATTVSIAHDLNSLNIVPGEIALTGADTCTLTFATPWASAPIITLSPASAGEYPSITPPTTTAVVFTNAGSSAVDYFYHMIGVN